MYRIAVCDDNPEILTQVCTTLSGSPLGKELELTVRDDGSGFTVSAQQAVKAYYHSNPRDDLEHSGLGMYISRLYCEKHGGRLAVGNAETGGAVVKAVFYAAEDGFQEHR